MAARSLGVKINQDCFDRPTDLQVSCLSQNSRDWCSTTPMRNHSWRKLTAGSTTDLMNQLSYSSLADRRVQPLRRRNR